MRFGPFEGVEDADDDFDAGLAALEDAGEPASPCSPTFDLASAGGVAVGAESQPEPTTRQAVAKNPNPMRQMDLWVMVDTGYDDLVLKESSGD